MEWVFKLANPVTNTIHSSISFLPDHLLDGAGDVTGHNHFVNINVNLITLDPKLTQVFIYQLSLSTTSGAVPDPCSKPWRNKLDKSFRL